MKVKELVIAENKKIIQFFLIQIISAFISIVMGKLIAIYFETSTFGKYAIITSITAFFSSVFASPALQSFRFAFNRIKLSSLLSFYRTLFLFITLFLFAISFVIGLTSTHIVFLFSLYISLYLFIQINYDLNMCVENIRGQNLAFSIYQIGLTTVSIICLILTIFILKISSVWTLLISNIIPVLLMLLVSSWRTKDVLTFNYIRFNKWQNHEWRVAFGKFMKPLFLLPFFSWLLNYGDKFIIRIFYDDNQLSLYAAAYSIGSKIFLMISGPAIIYLNQSTYKVSSDTTNFKLLWQNVIHRLKWYYVIGIIICIFLFFTYNIIGDLLLSPQYKSSFWLIPFLAFANLILTSFFFLEQIVYAIGDTPIIVKHNTIGAISNIALNIILVPLFNIQGATISMILAVTLQFGVLLFLVNKKLVSNF